MPGERSFGRWDAAAVLLFALASIVFTYPLAAHLSDHVPGDPHDSLYTLYALSYDYRVLGGEGSILGANIFYPNQGTLFYGVPLFGLALIGAPIRLFSRNPVLLFNILFLSSFFLCGAGLYFLARRLTDSRPAALLGGLVFAFFPYRFAHISHLEILYFAWIPFCLLFMHRFFEKASWGNAVGMAVFFILQVLCCAYYGAFFALFAFLFVVYYAAKTGFWKTGRFWSRAAVFAALCLAVLGPYFYSFIKLHQGMRFLRPRWEVELFSAQLQNFLAVPPWNRLWGGLTGGLGGHEWQLYPGLVPLVLFVLYWRSIRHEALSAEPRGRPARRSPLWRIWDAINAVVVLSTVFLAATPGFKAVAAGVKISGRRLQDPLTLLIISLVGRCLFDGRIRGRIHRVLQTAGTAPKYYTAAVVAAGALSFGPSVRIFGRKILTGPYEWVYRWVPGFQSLRASSRFTVVVMLGLAVLSAMAAARFLNRMPARRRMVAVGILATVVLLEYFSVPIPLSSVPLGREVPAIYAVVAALPAEATLVELPMPTRDNEEWRESWPVYYSIYHWKRLVNGYSGYSPPAYRVVREAMQEFPSKSAFDLLESLEVGYVLVRTRDFDAAKREDFFRRMLQHRQRADPVADADGFSLYKILPWYEAHRPAENPLRLVGDKRLWTGRAGLNSVTVGRAFDGNPATFWTTGYPQQKGDFLTIDLGRVETFERIDLRLQSEPLDYPRNFSVEASPDGAAWTPLDAGRNSFPLLTKRTVEDFSAYKTIASRVPGEARYLRITITESHPTRHWSVAEVDLLGR